MASRLVVVTPSKYALQGKSFSCKTGGNWTRTKRKIGSIDPGAYGIHFCAPGPKREGTELLVHIRTFEEERESNWFPTDLRRDELGLVELSTEGDIENLIKVQGTQN